MDVEFGDLVWVFLKWIFCLEVDLEVVLWCCVVEDDVLGGVWEVDEGWGIGGLWGLDGWK